MMKYNILIGGSAGQGMDTISSLLEKILQRKGYYVFSNKDYMSRVRGGHNFIQIRFGNEPIYSYDDKLDIIIGLDQNSVEFHSKNLKKDGVFLCDDKIKWEDERRITIPMLKIAKEIGQARVFGTVGMGAIIKLLSLDDSKIEEVFNEKWDEKIANDNIEAFNKGYEYVDSKYKPKKGEAKDTLLINGNQAIALGALAGGLSFYGAYPMTPSTSIMTYLSTKQNDAGIVVEQAEDEIAAINMAIGASFTGVRAMTGTSGGGFSLMTEALGLAGITETPLVTVNVQRPGPATGLPTRTEQSDLSFILTASHGEIPRMVLSVKNPEDAFYQTARALNIADKYQMLVIILNDQFLADANQTVNKFDFDKVTIERHISGENDINKDDYKRYEITENGLSKRIIPGKIEGVTVLADSDEHDEYGHITEESEVRISQMDKRMKRMELLKDELIEPDYFGVDDPETLLIGWGSLYGGLREAVETLKDDGEKIGALIFGDIYPLPTKLLEKYSKNAKNIVNVEQNFNGQLAKFIRQETGIHCNKSILKYDGRQLYGKEIVSKLQEEVL